MSPTFIDIFIYYLTLSTIKIYVFFLFFSLNFSNLKNNHFSSKQYLNISIYYYNYHHFSAFRSFILFILNINQFISFIFSFPKKYLPPKNSSGRYENPLSSLFPSPQSACSPGSCKLNTALIPSSLKTFVKLNSLISLEEGL